MSYDIKPRPRPKSVAEWRDKRRERYGNAGDSGGFRLLPVKVLDSDAFNELSKSGKLVLIFSLSQIDYWVKKYHKNHPRRESSIGPLRNDARFSLPSNLLKERGIKSSETIAEARRELVAAGFWEVVETGTLYNTGVFRWSDNWLTYNQRSVTDRKRLDPKAKPTGYCHYPNIIQHNEGTLTSKAGGSSFTDKQGSNANPHKACTDMQLELFAQPAV
jgi:hypothetical protein